MVFSSSIFLLVFLPFFLLIYFVSADKYKNVVALLGSLYFYAWGAPNFFFILLITVIVDFFLTQRMVVATTGKGKNLLLILSIVMNIGLLGYFKYSNFFIDNWYAAFGNTSDWVKIALPVGISFFTFQKMSYSVDVYRGTKSPLDNIVDYGVFVLLFPQLIAGPIVRYGDIADEIKDRKKNFTDDAKILGLFRFSIGLAKKVILANILGAESDKVFETGLDDLSTGYAWYGALMYTFQIYFDFSGYSDMAIGLGRMLGFTFPENFNSPYVSKSITEFWQRWHMTLGAWMKDYLYIPLGGNKVSNQRLYINLCVVFLISGFWHGASWNFIIWGAYHGGLLALERLFLGKLLKKIPSAISISITFFLTVIGWIVFKLEDWVHTREFIKTLFTFDFKEFKTENYVITVFVIAMFVSFVSLIPTAKEKFTNMTNELPSNGRVIIVFSLTFILLIASVSGITSTGFNPFIYFQF